MIETTYAEILDKYLILCIKHDKIGGDHIKAQKEYFGQFIDNQFSLEEIKLYEIHRELWDAENYIRIAIEDKDKELVFWMSKKICELNGQRNEIKNSLGAKETKCYET